MVFVFGSLEFKVFNYEDDNEDEDFFLAVENIHVNLIFLAHLFISLPLWKRRLVTLENIQCGRML